jgi:hypothetical protein
MKRLLVVLVFVAAGVIGLAFYLGWIGFTSDSAGDNLNITFTVNKDKVQQDEKTAVQKVQAIGHGAKDETTAPTETHSAPE